MGRSPEDIFAGTAAFAYAKVLYDLVKTGGMPAFEELVADERLRWYRAASSVRDAIRRDLEHELVERFLRAR